MAASDIYQQGTKLFYSPSPGTYTPISDPAQLQTLAKQGAVKVGTPYLPLPTNTPPVAPAPTPVPTPSGGSTSPSPVPAPVGGGSTLTTPTAPVQGSNMAFQQAFGKLMENATKNQALQDQMQSLIRARYDGVTAVADPALPPDVQRAIRDRDTSALDFQIASMRQQLQGRSTDQTNALQYLVSGYQSDVQAVQQRQQQADAAIRDMLKTYGSTLSQVGVTQDELQQYENTGIMPPALATKLMQASTISQQKIDAGKVQNIPDANGNLIPSYFDTASGKWVPVTVSSTTTPQDTSNYPTSADASSLAEAIKQVESGGNYEAKGASGEFGAYQFMPSTWSSWSQEYAKANGIMQSIQPTKENQDAVAKFKIQKWLDQGYKPDQIASLWNHGKPEYAGVKGTNAKGVAYDTPAYVGKVMTALGKSGTSGDYGKIGLLANTDYNEKNRLDKAAKTYLDYYLKTGTMPTYTTLFGRATAAGGLTMADVQSRAQDLFYKATGSALPDLNILKSNKSLITSNNKLANNLRVQEGTVKANVDLSLKNMNEKGLNSSGFRPLDILIDQIKEALQDPGVGQLVSQNLTIQNELGSLLSVRNAGGTTVHDKLLSAGIINSSDSPAVMKQKIDTLISEAGNLAKAISDANADLYSQIDPLQTDSSNPNRKTSASGQSDSVGSTYKGFTLPF